MHTTAHEYLFFAATDVFAHRGYELVGALVGLTETGIGFAPALVGLLGLFLDLIESDSRCGGQVGDDLLQAVQTFTMRP